MTQIYFPCHLVCEFFNLSKLDKFIFHCNLVHHATSSLVRNTQHCGHPKPPSPNPPLIGGGQFGPTTCIALSFL